MDAEALSVEALSFIRLREIVDAKLARKLSLQVEIAAIDSELAEAKALLGEIPNLMAAVAVKALVAVAPMPEAESKTFRYPVKETVRPCEACHLPSLRKVTRKYCMPCYRAQAGARMRVNGARRHAVTEIDRGLITHGVIV